MAASEGFTPELWHDRFWRGLASVRDAVWARRADRPDDERKALRAVATEDAFEPFGPRVDLLGRGQWIVDRVSSAAAAMLSDLPPAASAPTAPLHQKVVLLWALSLTEGLRPMELASRLPELFAVKPRTRSTPLTAREGRIRAAMWLPGNHALHAAEEGIEKLYTKLIASIGGTTIDRLREEILTGRHIVVAHRSRILTNPITGDTIPSSSFFDELAETVASERNVIVLDFDMNDLYLPAVYLPSYNLVKIASNDIHFAPWKRRLRAALAAYDARTGSRRQSTNPWRTRNGGAKFVASIVRESQANVVAFLRHVHMEPDGKAEGTYVYASEIPTLARTMSVVFDVWPEDDWSRIRDLVNYLVDDCDGKRLLTLGGWHDVT